MYSCTRFVQLGPMLYIAVYKIVHSVTHRKVHEDLVCSVSNIMSSPPFYIILIYYRFYCTAWWNTYYRGAKSLDWLLVGPVPEPSASRWGRCRTHPLMPADGPWLPVGCPWLPLAHIFGNLSSPEGRKGFPVSQRGMRGVPGCRARRGVVVRAVRPGGLPGGA